MLLLAGCIGVEGDGAPAAETQSTEQADDDTSPTAKASTSELFPDARDDPLKETNATDWYTAGASASQPAEVTAFRWVVPEDTVRPYPYSDGDSTVYLDVVPVVEDADALEQFALYAFDLSADEAEPLSLNVQTTVTFTERSAVPGAGGETTVDVEPEPYRTLLGISDVQAGDEVGVVLVAESTVPQPVGIAFEPLETSRDLEEEPPEDLDGLRADTEPDDPVALDPEGGAEKAHAGLYLEANGMLSGVTLASEDVEVAHEGSPDLRPTATVRDTRIESTFDTSSGTSGAAAVYLANAAVGSWQASVDAHGESTQAEGTVVHANAVPGGSAAYLVFGLPFLVGFGGGEGSSSIAMDVEATSANAGTTTQAQEFFATFHYGFGASMESLYGVPAAQDSGAFTGLVGGAAEDDPTRIERTDTSVAITPPGGPHVTLPSPDR